jgi:hypothetical protein
METERFNNDTIRFNHPQNQAEFLRHPPPKALDSDPRTIF